MGCVTCGHRRDYHQARQEHCLVVGCGCARYASEAQRMGESPLRATIEQRVKSGILPQHGLITPEAGTGEVFSILMGLAAGRRCSACDGPNADVRYGDLAFHVKCHEVWATVCDELADDSE